MSNAMASYRPLYGEELQRQLQVADLAIDEYLASRTPGMPHSDFRYIAQSIILADPRFRLVFDLDGETPQSLAGVACAVAEGLALCFCALDTDLCNPDVVGESGSVSQDSYLYRVLDVLEEGADPRQQYPSWNAPDQAEYVRRRDSVQAILASKRFLYDLGVEFADRERFAESSMPSVQPEVANDSYQQSSGNGDPIEFLSAERCSVSGPTRLIVRPPGTSLFEEVTGRDPNVTRAIRAEELVDALQSANPDALIEIRGLDVYGPVILDDWEHQGSLSFTDCHFYSPRPINPLGQSSQPPGGPIRLWEASTGTADELIAMSLNRMHGSTLTFRRCRAHSLRLIGIRLVGDLDIYESVIAKVSLANASVGGTVRLVDMGVARTLRLPSLTRMPDNLGPNFAYDCPSNQSVAVIRAAGLRAGNFEVDGGTFDRIDLASASIANTTLISSSQNPTRVTGWLSLIELETSRLIVNRSDIGSGGSGHGLWAREARIGALSIREGCRIHGRLSIPGARVTGSARIGAQCIDPSSRGRVPQSSPALSLDLTGIRVGGNLSIGLIRDEVVNEFLDHADTRFSSPSITDHAHLAGQLRLREAVVGGALLIAQLDVACHAGGQDPSITVVSIDAAGLRVGGELQLEKVSTSGRVLLDGMQADVLHVRTCIWNVNGRSDDKSDSTAPRSSAWAVAGISMRNVMVAREAVIADSACSGTWSLAHSTIGELLFGLDRKEDTNRPVAITGGVLDAMGITIRGETFLNAVGRAASDAEGSTRGDEPEGESRDTAGRGPSNTTAPFTRLTDSRLGSLTLGPMYYESGMGLVSLVGSTFRALYFAADGTNHAARRQGVKLTAGLISTYSLVHYEPSPYLAAARMYEGMGDGKAASNLRILRHRDERRCGELSTPSIAWNHVKDRLARYGYDMSGLWISLVALVLATVGFAIYGAQAGVFIPTQLAPGASAGTTGFMSTCTPDYPCFNWLLYIMDLVVPIANFQQADYWQPVGWLVPTILGVATLLIWAVSIFLIAYVSSFARAHREREG